MCFPHPPAAPGPARPEPTPSKAPLLSASLPPLLGPFPTWCPILGACAPGTPVIAHVTVVRLYDVVPVSRCCCNKSLPIQWPKTTQVYYQLWRSECSVGLAGLRSRWRQGCVHFWRLQRRLCQCPEAACFLAHDPPTFPPAMAGRVCLMSHHCASLSHS